MVDAFICYENGSIQGQLSDAFATIYYILVKHRQIYVYHNPFTENENWK